MRVKVAFGCMSREWSLRERVGIMGVVMEGRGAFPVENVCSAWVGRVAGRGRV